MEILFKNNYTRDKEWAIDIYRYIYFRRPIMIAFFVLFAFYLIWGIYDSIVGNSFNWCFVSLSLVWAALVILLYNKNVKTIIKRDIEIHGKAIEVTVTVTDESIKQTQSTGSEYQLNYNDIKMAVHTKNYIYLWSKTNLLYSFKKDSFSIGNKEDFLIFLKNKGIKVR